MRTWLVRLGSIALLVGLGLSMETGKAYSCFCGPELTPRVAAREADMVFVGTVVSKEEKAYHGTPRIFTTFEVSAVWKGPPRETVVLTRRSGIVPGPACQYVFRRGPEYLVYAYERPLMPEEPRAEEERSMSPVITAYATSTCTRTRHVAGAQADLRALRGTDLSPWQIRLLAAGAVALAAAGIVTIRRRSENPRP